MDMTVTLIAAAVCLVLAVLCGWRGAQPLNIQKGPRLMPWRPLMMLLAVAFLVLLAHAANLLGVKTGDRNGF
ncbi:MAG: hypothetical protein JWP92_3003 [Caulobacter sp.]|jgi:hypothetical protein|nr:hypothetical protein [Caulobacter sp.]